MVHTLKTTNLQVAKGEKNTATQIVNNTVSAAMQHAVDGISVFLFADFSSRFLSVEARRPDALSPIQLVPVSSFMPATKMSAWP